MPHAPTDTDTLGAALWLERAYWDNMANAVELGIAKAFGEG